VHNPIEAKQLGRTNIWNAGQRYKLKRMKIHMSRTMDEIMLFLFLNGLCTKEILLHFCYFRNWGSKDTNL